MREIVGQASIFHLIRAVHRRCC